MSSPDLNQFKKAPRQIDGYTYVKRNGTRVKVPDHERHYWVRYVERARGKPKAMRQAIDPRLPAGRMSASQRAKYLEKGWIDEEGYLTSRAPLGIMKGVTTEVLAEMEAEGITIEDLWGEMVAEEPIILVEETPVETEEVSLAEIREMLPATVSATPIDTRARERVERGVVMATRFTPEAHRIMVVQPRGWSRDRDRDVVISKVDDAQRFIQFGKRGNRVTVRIDDQKALREDVSVYARAMDHLKRNGKATWSEREKKYFIDEDTAKGLVDYFHDNDMPMGGSRTFLEWQEQYNEPTNVSPNEMEIEIDPTKDYVILTGPLGYNMGRKLREDTTVEFTSWEGGRPNKEVRHFVFPENGGFRVPLVFFLDSLPDLAKRYNTKFTIIDNRDWSTGDPKELITSEKFPGLRPYQQELVDLALIKGSGMLKAPTGSGKTEMGAAIIGETGKDAVWLTHRKSLVEQSEDRLEKRLGMDVGVFHGDKKQILNDPRGMDINVMSVQSVERAISDMQKLQRGEKRIGDRGFSPERVREKQMVVDTIRRSKLQMFDEAHHLKAATFSKIYHLNPNAVHRYGLTATPYNRDDWDQMAIVTKMGKPFGHITPSFLIRKGYLAKPNIKFIERPHTRVSNEQGVLNYSEKTPKWIAQTQRSLVRNPVYNNMIARITRKNTRQNKNTLIMVDQIEHGERIKDQLLDLGVSSREIRLNMAQHAKRNPDGSFKYKQKAKVYGRGRRRYTKIVKELETSSVSKAQSQRMLDDFKSGDYDVMIATVGKAGEGVDIPIVDNVVIADGGKSYVETMQKLGRGLRRPKGGRPEVQVYDFVHPEEILDRHSAERLDIYSTEEEFDIERVGYNEAMERFT